MTVSIMKNGVVVQVENANVAFTLPEPSTNPNDYPLNPAQFKALVGYLNKDAAIRAAIAHIPDPMQKAWSLSRYENSVTYRHNDPFLQSMREAVEMSEEDLAAAWMIAKDLKSGDAS
jgi:hypothetical protein